MKKKTFKARQVIGYVMLVMLSTVFFRYIILQVGFKLFMEMFTFVILIPAWALVAAYLITAKDGSEKDGIGTGRNG